MIYKQRIGIFIVVSFLSILITRLMPHPPNFTTTIAIAFYLPALFGFQYVLVALTAFVLSDIIIGLHMVNHCIDLENSVHIGKN